MAEELIDESTRLAALIAAEERAFALFDAIEAAELVAPGRTERAVEQDIRALALGHEALAQARRARRDQHDHDRG